MAFTSSFVNKVSKSIGILCKVRNYLDKTTLHNLYSHSFIPI